MYICVWWVVFVCNGLKLYVLLHNTIVKFFRTQCPKKPQNPYAAAAAKSLQLCPTLRPQRRQPTRLPRPWDSPGKNTGVHCHFLLQCMKVKSFSRVQLFATPWTAA